ncbi:hypothetical protein ABZ815_49180 [Nonomuraea sp. NPDC047529]|uniref:hypothetical protein n=1 Tax=Nonomuraea sp. NPDC047529 TaxID=3155623 RepID=UPI0033CFD0D5
MSIETTDGVPRIRVRLTATLAQDGFVDEKIAYVLEADEQGEPTRRSDMSRYDRGNMARCAVLGDIGQAGQVASQQFLAGRPVQSRSDARLLLRRRSADRCDEPRTDPLSRSRHPRGGPASRRTGSLGYVLPPDITDRP